jgi:hypothetical protein
MIVNPMHHGYAGEPDGHKEPVAFQQDDMPRVEVDWALYVANTDASAAPPAGASSAVFCPTVPISEAADAPYHVFRSEGLTQTVTPNTATSAGERRDAQNA